GQINPTTGTINEFTTPTLGSGPSFIASGPAGSNTLWFSEYSIGRVARITTSGTITEYPLPTVSGSLPDGIVAAVPPNDNTLWVLEFGASQIANVVPNPTPSATPTITEYPIPTTPSNPTSAAIGTDHGLWFTEAGANKIGRRQIP
ncbi:MAG TPA: hypothetical protein VNJ51_13295, partial [Candidatus Dormibacteraeota bacterium]|nr:hypothetical protein [Candidatus Dormibacteraeota bacterium]